jgi:hypothetical protein
MFAASEMQKGSLPWKLRGCEEQVPSFNVQSSRLKK